MADVVQAVRLQLQSHLQTQLLSKFPGLTVLQEWPAAGKLQSDYVITILAQGEGETDPHPPVTISTTPGGGNAGSVIYQTARIEQLPLTIDCFAATPVGRDNLAAEVRHALSLPPSATLPGASTSRRRFGHAPNVTLLLAQMFNAPWTYRFEEVQSVPEDSQAAQTGDWRSTWRGWADGPRWEQDTSFPLMKKIGIKYTQDVRPQETVLIQGAIVALAIEGSPTTLVARTTQLRAVAILDDGSTIDVTAQAAWSTAKPVVATVGASTGLVTGVAYGHADITATYGGKSSTRSVYVGVITMRRVISQPADGSDFRVTLPTAQPNDTYKVIPAIVKNSSFVEITCPDDLAGDRTTTDFRCKTEVPLDDGALVDFTVVPS